MMITTVFITDDGVDITRLVRLHRKYHGVPVACAVRRYREEVAQWQTCGLTEADEQHERGDEPPSHQDQRGWVLTQAGAETRLGRVASGSISPELAG